VKDGHVLAIHMSSKVFWILTVFVSKEFIFLLGSCSLQYRLVEVPGALRNGKTDSPIFGSKCMNEPSRILGT